MVVTDYGGKIEYQDIPVPKPGPNDILVNIKYSGVCNSDYHIWKGDWIIQAPLPVVPGHEGAGIVVAKGANVTNFEIGDYAGVKWINSTCQSCEYCESGWETVCPTQTNSGFSVPGTFQQYTLANAVQAAHIPKNVDLAGVAPLLCAGITVYKGLKEANIKAGEWIGIIGAGGGLGSLAVQYAKALNYKVIGIDSSSKKDYMKQKGADKVVCFDEVDSVPEAALEASGGGCHAVINVSSNAAAYNDAVKYIRPAGTVVVVGLPKGQAFLQSEILTHALRAINIKGSVVGNRKDTREALQFFADGQIESPVKVVGLSQVQSVFEKMERGEIFGRYVVDTSK